MKKFIGDKLFYRKVFTIIIPIMLQQLFLSLAGYIDNVMINYYGVNAYNGVSAANRLMFVCNFVWIGIICGVNIFTSQFFGANNKEKVKETIRFSTYISSVFAIIMFVVITFLGNKVVDTYLTSQESREFGYQYLNVMKYGNLFVAINMSMANAYRSIQKPKIPLIIGTVGIGANIIMNYIFIFGKLGCPAMGASGAALATILSKAIEMIIYFVTIPILKNEWMVGLFRKLSVSKEIIVGYFKRGTLIAVNEFCFSAGIVILAKFYTYHNDVWYNAYSYTQNISDLFFIIFAGLGNGTAILIGSSLGEGKFEQAEREMNYFRGLAIVMGVLVGGLMIATSPLTARLFTKDKEVLKLMVKILAITGIFTAVYCYNNVCYFVLRAGGDSGRAMILDQGPTYAICIPLAIILGTNASRLGITIVEIYLTTHVTDIIKIFLSNFFINKKKWLKNLTIE